MVCVGIVWQEIGKADERHADFAKMYFSPGSDIGSNNHGKSEGSFSQDSAKFGFKPDWSFTDSEVPSSSVFSSRGWASEGRTVRDPDDLVASGSSS